MRAGVLLFAVALAGCRTILGLDEPRLVDASVDDMRPSDAALDAELVQGCPTQFALLAGVGGTTASQTRYYALSAAMSFTAAAQACTMFTTSADRHTHLVVLSDDTELTAVYDAFVSPDTTAGAHWIGLARTSALASFQWVTVENTNGYPPSSGTPWAAGEPAGTNEDCGAIMKSSTVNGGLETTQCATMLRAICECDGYADDPTRY